MLLSSLPGSKSYRLLLLLLVLLLLLLLLDQHFHISNIMNSSRLTRRNVTEAEYRQILAMGMVSLLGGERESLGSSSAEAEIQTS